MTEGMTESPNVVIAQPKGCAIRKQETQQKWKFAIKICIGCKTNEESGDEILLCEKLNYQNRVSKSPINYNWFFKSTVSDIVKVGLVLKKGLKEREKILEAAVT